MPGGDPSGDVGADDEPALVAGELGQGVGGVGPPVASHLTIVGNEVVDPIDGEPGHLPAILNRAHPGTGLLPRGAGGEERHHIETELLMGGLAGNEMGKMGWIEGSAEDAAPHPVHDRGRWRRDAPPERCLQRLGTRPEDRHRRPPPAATNAPPLDRDPSPRPPPRCPAPPGHRQTPRPRSGTSTRCAPHHRD